MPVILRLLIVLGLSWAMSAAAFAQEYDTHRPGSDYRDFKLSAPDFNLCRSTCNAEASCVAWTYQRPNEDGSRAHCWLKSKAPQRVYNDCCVSGVKQVTNEDSADRCRDYATRAVSQNDENLRRQCGLTGERWQSNRRAHFDWCMDASQSQSKSELDIREKLLTQCKNSAGSGDDDDTACRDYAEKATTAAKEAERLGCGLYGDRWTRIYTRHYNWCRLANRNERTEESAKRFKELKVCRAEQDNGADEACQTYAEQAVQQNADNKKLNCGLTGERWQSRIEPHYKLCLTLDADGRLAESDTRRRALRRCREASNTGNSDRAEACRDYSEAAAGQQAENRRLSCGYTGENWSSSTANHFDWCMNNRRADREALFDQRKRDLLRCREEASQGDGPDCADYAAKSVKDAKENSRLNCGFAGGRWSPSADRHVSWCKSAPPQARAKEQKARRALLDLCSANPDKADRCQRYSNSAVEHQRTNLQNGCGFTGARWNNSYEDHFVFCMNSPRLVRKLESFARESALASCR